MLVRVIAGALQARLSVATIYLLTTLGAARRPAESVHRRSTDMRVVVFVPAHDEQRDVASTVASLLAQDHPDHLRETIVIADNCTDATVEVAGRAGATVWERTVPERRGKGAALSWALERALTERPDAEAFAIVDADCLASPNLVSGLAAALGAGADAAQADYEVSNPDASSEAALRAAGFALKHRVRARGRARLGLSCNLFGTGMAFTRASLADARWSESVTEDTEMFLRLIESGRRIAYVPQAVVTSAMPVDGRQAADQQVRWETGNLQLRRARLARLLTGGVLRRDRELLGAAAELALPSQSALLAGETGILTTALMLHRRGLGLAAATTLAGQIAYVVGGLTTVADVRSVAPALIRAPAFVIGRLGVLGRVGLGRGARSWQRTQRSQTNPATSPSRSSQTAPPAARRASR